MGRAVWEEAQLNNVILKMPVSAHFLSKGCCYIAESESERKAGL